MKMLSIKNKRLQKKIFYILFFLITLFLVIIRPLGFDLSRVPGGLGDSRFNNYILEHNYQWISGKAKNLLSPPFAYPFNNTITFSDNHFGSMLFFSIPRWLGLDRESAFQIWFIFSFVLNYIAAVYVLDKLSLNPIAVGLGAFFFTFSLPVLAKINHVQLSYRFCVPLACYSLLQIAKKPNIKNATLLVYWVVWQFFISIYLGFFLSLLLISLVITIPIFDKSKSSNYLNYWLKKILLLWNNSRKSKKIICSTIILSLLLGLIGLLYTYASTSSQYGFTRAWGEISSMLPRIPSYLIADYSKPWSTISSLFTSITQMRWEHQLFIGLSAITIIIVGLLWRPNSPCKNEAFSFLFAALLLIILTLRVNNFSLYKYFLIVPGVNSIRAVTRIILILLWPFSFFIAYVLNAIQRSMNTNNTGTFILLFITMLMFVESIFFNHQTFDKKYAQFRAESYKDNLPHTLPEDPILYIWDPNDIFWGLPELDAMLLSQEFGWPTLNGYSGNLPPGYGPAKDCDQASIRIIRYLNFIDIFDMDQYDQLISRVVFIGPENCEMNTDIQNLEVTYSEGPFSESLITGISLEINSMNKKGDYLFLEIIVRNNSKHTLPAESSTNNPFKLSWRFQDVINDIPIGGFDTRKSLISDIKPGSFLKMTIITPVPETEGNYKIEISAVQENVFWFHDKGMLPVRSKSLIKVDDKHDWSIE